MSFGKCSKCPSSARSGLLIGGLCSYHFKGGGEVERNDAPQVEKLKVLAAKNKTLKSWFDEQIKQCPDKCENCGQKIIIPPDITKRAAIAHVLPKKLFKSVSTNELNRVFLCLICHSNFDSKGNDFAAKMPVAKIAKQRFENFKDLIAEEEKKHIPPYLLKK
jgi:hypothetical protein